MRYDGVAIRIAMVSVCLVTMAASAAPATMKLKDVKLRGTAGTEQIIDWVVTSSKAGIVIACDDDSDKQCGPGLALLKPNGKSKPFKSLGHDEASAAIAWPGGGTSARRPKPRGVVVVAAEVEEQLFLYSGLVLNKGRVKGGLREQALVETGTKPSTTLIDAQVKAAMYGNHVGAVVAFTRRDGLDAPTEAILFFLLNSKGKLRKGPVELTYPGETTNIANELLDIVGDENGWHILAGNAPNVHKNSRRGQGRLLAWTVPVGAARAEFAARTIAETKMPGKAVAVRYRATFVRDLEPLTVFYDESITWETAEARRRDVGLNETTRYLTPFNGSGRGARTEVAVQTWDRVSQFWDRGPISIADLDDRTSAAIARGVDHVFAISRDLDRHTTNQQSFLEQAQEFSVYKLNPGTGKTELLLQTERREQLPGHFWPVLIRQFGQKTAVIFNFDDTFAHLDRPVLTSF